jgi:hypothetical protein
MKKFTSESSWSRIKKVLRSRWPWLNEADLAAIDFPLQGELGLRHLQERLGGTSMDVARLIADILEAGDGSWFRPQIPSETAGRKPASRSGTSGHPGSIP